MHTLSSHLQISTTPTFGFVVPSARKMYPNWNETPDLNGICPPPIRWAGGKRLLAHRLLQFTPKQFGKYYEPMVGSGALFFALCPKNGVLADINKDLINFYRVLRNQPRPLYSEAHRNNADRGTYYSIRSQQPSLALEKAVRFLFLIRLSWNGLYRVNKQGQFNVPYGGRSPVQLISLEKILRASKVLKGVELKRGDFEKTVSGVQPGDFVFFDPPYPKGASIGNGFARYNEMGFSLDDHRRLALLASRLADQGVHVMITEAARKEILKHFSREFHITLVRKPSLIAAESRYRRDACEAILTSYSPEGSKNSVADYCHNKIGHYSSKEAASCHAPSL
jgi:DNA adenine methylase